MLNINNIMGAIDKAAERKRSRRDVQLVLADKAKYACIIQRMLREHSYAPPTYKLHKIKEGSRQKEREIEKPRFKYDQIIQHVLITQLKPIVMRSLYAYAHGSLERRGPLQTAKAISGWIRDDPKGTRYCLQMDVHHCYPSVDQEVLIGMYHRKVRDADFNQENDKVIRSCPKGLALGAPTSVWHIHFLFTPFDHWLAGQDGVAHYLRHADDIVVFGPNKRKLHRVERGIMDYMKSALHMEINHNRQVFPIEWTDRRGKAHGRPLDVCGYLFYRDRTILRKSRMLGITRKAARVAKKEKPTHYDAAQMLSQMGWLDHCDVYNVRQNYIKGKASKQRMRALASKHQKKLNERRKENAEIRNGGELRAGEAAGGGRVIQRGRRLPPEEHPGSGRCRGRDALEDGGSPDHAG